MQGTPESKEKVLIPNRGVIALDILYSLKSIGLETILLYSPADSLSLPVKLADKSYKFYSSKLEDSYMDLNSIIEKAIELKVDYIHPGYGFLSERPEFSKLCRDNNINFIGPEYEILKIVENKIELLKTTENLGIKTLNHSNPITSSLESESISHDLKFPLIIKPIKGSGGNGIVIAEYRKDAMDKINALMQRDKYQKSGIFVEEFLPYAHEIEIPFIRDIKGNIIFLPEIESSVQRRFQKIFQESPSVNVSENLRQSMYENSKKIIEKINYMGLGYIEFIVENDNAYFSEINPTFQINTMIPEIHIKSNFIKKQFAISRGELLHNVNGVKIVKPDHKILLVSLMAENPDNNFQPSSGTITEFFHYSTLRDIFKTHLYTGSKVPPIYDPYIGKILTFTQKRETAISNMRNFLDNIIIRGIRTNLNFLKNLLDNESLKQGKTIIDFLNLKHEVFVKPKTEEEILIAAALVSAEFHLQNRKKNYKAKLEKMKQPGFFKKIIKRILR